MKEIKYVDDSGREVVIPIIHVEGYQYKDIVRTIEEIEVDSEGDSVVIEVLNAIVAGSIEKLPDVAYYAGDYVKPYVKPQQPILGFLLDDEELYPMSLVIACCLCPKNKRIEKILYYKYEFPESELLIDVSVFFPQYVGKVVPETFLKRFM